MDFDALLNAELSTPAEESSSDTSAGRVRSHQGPLRKRKRRSAPESPYRVLVVVPAGDESLHSAWTVPRGEENGNIEIAVVYYGDKDEIAQNYEARASHFMRAKGAKWTLVRRALEELVPKWRQMYTHIWLPDDDLKFDTSVEGEQRKALEKFLSVVHIEGLKLCQPALVDNGNITPAYKNVLAVQPECKFHWTNFVEIMCPCFEVRTLSRLYQTLDKAQCGWGLDSVWSALLNFRDMAVVDVTPIEHTRPPSAFYAQSESSFYAKLGIDPGREEFELLQAYGVQPFRKQVKGRVSLEEDEEEVKAPADNNNNKS